MKNKLKEALTWLVIVGSLLVTAYSCWESGREWGTFYGSHPELLDHVDAK